MFSVATLLLERAKTSAKYVIYHRYLLHHWICQVILPEPVAKFSLALCNKNWQPFELTHRFKPGTNMVQAASNIQRKRSSPWWCLSLRGKTYQARCLALVLPWVSQHVPDDWDLMNIMNTGGKYRNFVGYMCAFRHVMCLSRALRPWGTIHQGILIW